MRRFVGIMLCVSMLGAGGPARPRPPRAVALLIGIADYKNFPPPPGEPGHTDLLGPGNDVERMRIALRRYGFAGDSNVRVLRDSAASRAGITAGFHWLAQRASDSTDIVVVFYSGHGSRARDTNGDEARTTPGDTTDEALVPWDVIDTSDPSQLIVDDQIGAWLGRLKTKNVTMIVDGCFSGTITRGLGHIVAKGTFSATRETGAAQRQLLDNPAHTLITAASSGETAYEMPFGPEQLVFGALTYELTRALDVAGPTAHYDEVMQQVTRAIRDNPEAPQTPQLEGDRTARLFHVAAVVPAQAFVLVTPVSDGRVRIDAGAVHGVRARAVYTVYGPGETRFEGAGLGQIIIDSVQTTSALARRLDTAVFPAGARAVLAQVPRGAERVEALRAYFAPGTEAALPFVRLSDSAHADVYVARSSEGLVVGFAEGIVVSMPEERSALCPRLARAFAIKAFDAIDNPAAPLSLELESRFVEVGAPIPTQGADVDTLRIGRVYDLYVRVGAPEGETLYLTVASQGFTGPPVVLVPDPAIAGPNQPFQPLNAWTRIVRGIPAAEPAGIERIKLLVGSDQYDFRSLLQTFPDCSAIGLRAVPGAPPPIRWRARRHEVVIQH